ncbi:hypothetical protein IWX90DRAFT_124587 [Phyllosticta citrichinensis]|uniref:Uncharacterized protein n=1 Tax=Phyllosticta citrichinensis TaxID=1130410 RepID=A0ABR1Y3Y1_9PEZI
MAAPGIASRTSWVTAIDNGGDGSLSCRCCSAAPLSLPPFPANFGLHCAWVCSSAFLADSCDAAARRSFNLATNWVTCSTGNDLPSRPHPRHYRTTTRLACLRAMTVSSPSNGNATAASSAGSTSSLAVARPRPYPQPLFQLGVPLTAERREGHQKRRSRSARHWSESERAECQSTARGAQRCPSRHQLATRPRFEQRAMVA